jgi:lysophospholipase L1-like esterase
MRRVVILIVAAALLAACMPDWTTNPKGAPRVAAVGDSILRQLEFYGPTHPDSDDALTQSIQDEGWRASVRGENGWITQWVRGLAKNASDNGADGIIIVSGLNDAWWISQQRDQRAGREYVAAQIRDTLQEIRRTDCVVWPTIPQAPDFFGRSFAHYVNVLRINAELRQQAARRPSLTVPEWGVEFDAHPDYRRGDGLHLSAQGEAALQDMVLGAMRECMPTQSASPQEVAPTTIPPNTGPTTIPTATTSSTTTTPPSTAPTTVGTTTTTSSPPPH